MMNLDDLLLEYFATTEVSLLSESEKAAGLERCQVGLHVERDRERRFLLWAVLRMYGSAPDLEEVFDDADDRDAARFVMHMLGAGERKHVSWI